MIFPKNEKPEGDFRSLLKYFRQTEIFPVLFDGFWTIDRSLPFLVLLTSEFPAKKKKQFLMLFLRQFHRVAQGIFLPYKLHPE